MSSVYPTKWLLRVVTLAIVLNVVSVSKDALAGDEAYLQWTAKQAKKIGEGLRSKGRVGGWLDTRILSTDRSYNYKLRATWLTPEGIRASARLTQLENLLSDDETRRLVNEAETAGETIVLVELDPREGSGVIPRDWVSVLRPRVDGERDVPAVRGESVPALRKTKALAGVMERDYDYSLFWVKFPLVDDEGRELFAVDEPEAELVVRIRGKEGRVRWKIPSSIRDRTESMLASR